ncbi:hypothetical protein [Spirillospora sp. CA-294931]|uniref:hypothetical protein n=1 Tax=Spirillospora sp. CA-294931 TaxID=3240042 RepID=UPI003D93D96A
MKAKTALALMLICLCACGIRPTGTIGAGPGPAAAAPNTSVAIYLINPAGKLVAVTRPGLVGDPYYPVVQLLGRPTTQERRWGLRNEVPQRRAAHFDHPAEKSLSITLEDDLPWTRLAQAQVICTAMTIPRVARVRLIFVRTGSTRYLPSRTCEDYRDLR